MHTVTHRILVMGVSGCGKTHIGQHLAAQLEADFIDGDDYHSPSSIAKMANGQPLNDDDRHEWLQTLAGLFESYRQRDASVVIGCSALKRRYRETLRCGDPGLAILYLKGSRELLLDRLAQRSDHFFKGSGMLDSQLNDLEPPDEVKALGLDIALPPQRIVSDFLQWLTIQRPID
ncbi:gluconokinase [Aidingimonas lacisalsi]|uniref:gluconokinase n=1 Tax=Aidingimonas lacisalsi TaxID=2604086 RepID=UPI0011D23F31|nr:gluconokinase [Aidingimonas lacisalsi]